MGCSSLYIVADEPGSSHTCHSVFVRLVHIVHLRKYMQVHVHLYLLHLFAFQRMIALLAKKHGLVDNCSELREHSPSYRLCDSLLLTGIESLEPTGGQQTVNIMQECLCDV